MSARSRSNWNLEVVIFEERWKPEYLEKNLSEQRREPTTNSTLIWLRCPDLKLGHTGGRRVLSPPRHHYLLTSQEWFTDLIAVKALWLEWTLGWRAIQRAVAKWYPSTRPVSAMNYCYSYLKTVIVSADLAFLARRQKMFLIGTVRGWVRLHCTCSWRRLFCSFSFFLLR